MGRGRQWRKNRDGGLGRFAGLQQPGGRTHKHDDQATELFVLGLPCTLFQDDGAAAVIEAGRHLLSWGGDADCACDRFDARLLLNDASELEVSPSTSRAEGTVSEDATEADLDAERYRDLDPSLEWQLAHPLAGPEGPPRAPSPAGPHLASSPTSSTTSSSGSQHSGASHSDSDSEAGEGDESDIGSGSGSESVSEDDEPPLLPPPPRPAPHARLAEALVGEGRDDEGSSEPDERGEGQGYAAVGFLYPQADPDVGSAPMPPPPPPPPPPPSEGVAWQPEGGDEAYTPPYDVPDSIPVKPGSRKVDEVVVETARFVRRGGGQAEVLLRVRQGGNPRFGFLDPAHPLHAYYRWHVAHQPPKVLAPPRPVEHQGADEAHQQRQHDAFGALQGYNDDERSSPTSSSHDGSQGSTGDADSSESDEPAAPLEHAVGPVIGPAPPPWMRPEGEPGGAHAGRAVSAVQGPQLRNELGLDGDAGDGWDSGDGSAGEQSDEGDGSGPCEHPHGATTGEGEEGGAVYGPLPASAYAGVGGSAAAAATETAGPHKVAGGAVHGPADTGQGSNPSALVSTPPAGTSTTGVLDLPTQAIINKLVPFVARSGAAFEATVRERERGNPAFAFLQPTHPQHATYRAALATALGSDTAAGALLAASMRLTPEPSAGTVPWRAGPPAAHTSDTAPAPPHTAGADVSPAAGAGGTTDAAGTPQDALHLTPPVVLLKLPPAGASTSSKPGKAGTASARAAVLDAMASPQPAAAHAAGKKLITLKPNPVLQAAKAVVAKIEQQHAHQQAVTTPVTGDTAPPGVPGLVLDAVSAAAVVQASVQAAAARAAQVLAANQLRAPTVVSADVAGAGAGAPAAALTSAHVSDSVAHSTGGNAGASVTPGEGGAGAPVPASADGGDQGAGEDSEEVKAQKLLERRMRARALLAAKAAARQREADAARAQAVAAHRQLLSSAGDHDTDASHPEHQHTAAAHANNDGPRAGTPTLAPPARPDPVAARTVGTVEALGPRVSAALHRAVLLQPEVVTVGSPAQELEPGELPPSPSGPALPSHPLSALRQGGDRAWGGQGAADVSASPAGVVGSAECAASPPDCPPPTQPFPHQGGVTTPPLPPDVLQPAACQQERDGAATSPDEKGAGDGTRPGPLPKEAVPKQDEVPAARPPKPATRGELPVRGSAAQHGGDRGSKKPARHSSPSRERARSRSPRSKQKAFHRERHRSTDNDSERRSKRRHRSRSRSQEHRHRSSRDKRTSRDTRESRSPRRDRKHCSRRSRSTSSSRSRSPKRRHGSQADAAAAVAQSTGPAPAPVPAPSTRVPGLGSGLTLSGLAEGDDLRQRLRSLLGQRLNQ